MNLQQLQETFDDYLSRCGVPFLTRQDMARLRATPATKAVDDWWADDLPSLLLLGGVGTGKTVAACAALAKNWRTWSTFMLEPGDMPPQYAWRSGVFVDMADLAGRGLFDSDGKLTLHRAREAALAILDDTGRERGDGAQALEDVFMARFAAGRKTIITANLSIENVKERLGARVIDRIQGNGRIVSTGAESLRGMGPRNNGR